MRGRCLHDCSGCFRLAWLPGACFGNGNWNPVPPRAILRAWQDMSLSELPSALEAVNRFAPRMLLLNPISTERSLYSS